MNATGTTKLLSSLKKHDVVKGGVGVRGEGEIS